MRRLSLLAAPVMLAAVGCTGSAGADGAQIEVTSRDDACEVSTDQAASGSLTFSVTNAGTKPTEFYLLADGGQSVVGEVEDIGPGLTRDLVVDAGPGDYLTSCKPGMVGEGIQAAFTVTG